jgi:hypothetical protein
MPIIKYEPQALPSEEIKKVWEKLKKLVVI